MPDGNHKSKTCSKNMVKKSQHNDANKSLKCKKMSKKWGTVNLQNSQNNEQNDNSKPLPISYCYKCK